MEMSAILVLVWGSVSQHVELLQEVSVCYKCNGASLRLFVFISGSVC